jgi:acid phosphatase
VLSRPLRFTALAAAPAVALALTSAACTSASVPGDAAAPASATASRTTAATATTGPAGRTAPGRKVSKVLVFVVENHSADQMRTGLPWVARLGDRYGHTTDYHGIRHPSLPNYLAIAGGSTFGVADDAGPAVNHAAAPSVFGRALAAGRTATVFADGMTSRCQTASEGRYAVKHNPWAYFAGERAQCRRHDLPLRRLSGAVRGGTLPAVGMVVPDLCHDAHDCALTVANRWLKRHVRAVMGGPDWASGRLAVVITADEDDDHHANTVLTVVAHPGLDHAVTGRAMSHYALSRSLSQVAGTAPLRKASKAPSLLRQLGLRPAPLSR